MRRALECADVAVPPVAALTSDLVDDSYNHITGQLALTSADEGIARGSDAAAQTEMIMRRILTLLATEGLDATDLVRITIFVTDPADVMPVNAVYTRHVAPPYPARSTIGAAFLALPGAKVEMARSCPTSLADGRDQPTHRAMISRQGDA